MRTREHGALGGLLLILLSVPSAAVGADAPTAVDWSLQKAATEKTATRSRISLNHFWQIQETTKKAAKNSTT